MQHTQGICKKNSACKHKYSECNCGSAIEYNLCFVFLSLSGVTNLLHNVIEPLNCLHWTKIYAGSEQKSYEISFYIVSKK